MAKLNFIEPYTKLWRMERLGCFTSSKSVRLLKGGTRPMTEAELKAREKGNVKRTMPLLFGDGAITYIDEKVSEIINKQEKFVRQTDAMKWGEYWESEAIITFTKVTGIQAEKTGLYKLGYKAGTPDFTVGKRKIKAIGEVKCFNSDNHSKLCELSTGEQLKDFDESIYCQMQMNMMLTDCKIGWFVSFDPRVIGYKDDGEIDEENYDENKFIFAIHIIKVKRDEAYIKDLDFRLDAAVDILIDKLGKRMKAADKNKKMYERTLNRLNKAA